MGMLMHIVYVTEQGTLVTSCGGITRCSLQSMSSVYLPRLLMVAGIEPQVPQLS